MKFQLTRLEACAYLFPGKQLPGNTGNEQAIFDVQWNAEMHDIARKLVNETHSKFLKKKLINTYFILLLFRLVSSIPTIFSSSNSKTE